MAPLRDRYHVRAVETSTVRDYTHYTDAYPELVGPKGDVKDVQRPWAYEKVRELVPRGAWVIDMGGSRCELAAALMNDYTVTIVDPYDGSGRGPTNVDELRKRYPRVRFVQALLDGAIDLPCEYAAVFSTSVLEHVPPDLVQDALIGIDKVLVPGGWSLHAIDFTVKGEGRGIRERTDAVIREVLAGYGVSETLDELRERVLADYETYYLSPLMYQQWKKKRAYDDYPWRLVTTINLVVQKTA